MQSTLIRCRDDRHTCSQFAHSRPELISFPFGHCNSLFHSNYPVISLDTEDSKQGPSSFAFQYSPASGVSSRVPKKMGPEDKSKRKFTSTPMRSEFVQLEMVSSSSAPVIQQFELRPTMWRGEKPPDQFYLTLRLRIGLVTVPRPADPRLPHPPEFGGSAHGQIRVCRSSDRTRGSRTSLYRDCNI